MKNVFLIFGYGVPKKIEKDINYNTYFRLVFNKIYNEVTAAKISKPIIIFCGGQTDVYPPFRRTEAQQMVSLWKILARRKFVRQVTKNWIYWLEAKSLSTLENLLETQQILKKRKINRAKLTIFCEATRQNRIKILGRKVFKNYDLKIQSIDFDISPSRYLQPKFIKTKESQELKLALWALKNPQNITKYKQAFKDRLAYFRQQGSQKHLQSIHWWWAEKLNQLVK